MPTIPPAGPAPIRTAQVDPIYMAMAAAGLHAEGRLFEDRAEPVKDALRSGTFDAVGSNATKFEARR